MDELYEIAILLSSLLGLHPAQLPFSDFQELLKSELATGVKQMHGMPLLFPHIHTYTHHFSLAASYGHREILVAMVPFHVGQRRCKVLQSLSHLSVLHVGSD